MIRTFSAMAIAGLVLMAVAGTSQAVPIAPLPAGVMADHGKVMQVRWHRRCRRRRLGPLALPMWWLGFCRSVTASERQMGTEATATDAASDQRRL